MTVCTGFILLSVYVIIALVMWYYPQGVAIASVIFQCT
jgi:hypothetical protein